MSRTYILTYIGLSNLTLSFRIFIATRFSEKTLLLWKFGFVIIAFTPISHPNAYYINMVTHILHDLKTALFINLNKFFSNSFFAKVLKFVWSSMHLEDMEIARIAVYDGSL